MLNKWYENEQLRNLSISCDNAYLGQDENELSRLFDECYNHAHNLSNDGLVRARYFYIAFTTYGNLVDLWKRNASEDDHDEAESVNLFETYHQKSLYLARNAFELLHSETDKNDEVSDEDLIYMMNFEYQLSVNYANFLLQRGRYIKATEILSIFGTGNIFPMGTAQLGVKIYELSRCHYDSSHQKMMLYKAYHYIKQASESDYLEKEEMSDFLERYKEHIVSMLGQDYLDKQYTINDFIRSPEGMSDHEAAYREWTARNKLSLNLLNDIFDSVEIAYDPLHLPSMTEKIDSNKVQQLFGLFNQIKQEYVSARFLAYEGFASREAHFSDKEVYMVNTLDYPVYGLGIEKIRACYRAVYSIFDKIAFLLNEYFEIGINRADIGYHRLFSPKRNTKDKVKVRDIAENNHPLKGMWWLFKDVRNINIDVDGKIDKVSSDGEYKHIDNVMNEISKVRNFMEHGYLKILDLYCKEALIDGQSDQLAYNISFTDFEKLTLELLLNAREAIILLVFSIKREEEIRATKRDPDTLMMSMYADRYDDEWKQIY